MMLIKSASRLNDAVRHHIVDGLVIVTLGAALATLQVDAAAAHLHKGAAAEISQAYAQFLALKAKDEAQGHLPRLSDPAAKMVLEQLWNEALLGERPYDASDLDLATIDSVEGNVIEIYAGAKPQGQGDDANYQDEFARGGSFTVAAVADTLDLAATIAAEGNLNSQQQQGMAAVINGATQTMTGSAKALDGSMNATNTHALADTMAKFAKRIAPHMPLSERQKIIAALTPDLVDADAATQADLNATIAALAGPECDVLCKSGAPANSQTASAKPRPAPSGPEQFYPLIGKWTGKAKFEIPGENALDLDMAIVCRKAGGSTALECDMHASNSQVSLVETDLMGVDKASGQASWFFVDNQGGAGLDHVKWMNADTMVAERSWSDGGQKMEAKGTFSIAGNTLDLRNEVTADGKTASVLSAKLTR